MYIKTTTTFFHRQTQTEMLNRIVNDMEPNETFFYWHHTAKEAQMGTNEDMKGQMKTWKRQKRRGELQLLEGNNREYEINGQMFYTLVVQDTDMDKNPQMDPLGFGVGFMVSGMMYWFKTKYARDVVFNYLK